MKIEKSKFVINWWVANHTLPDGTELREGAGTKEEAEKRMLALIEWNKPEENFAGRIIPPEEVTPEMKQDAYEQNAN